MTFPDDFVLVHFAGGTKHYTCEALGLSWPPPERISIMGFAFELRRRSGLTDEQREGMTHVCRGAEYVAAETQTADKPPLLHWN